MHGPHDSNYPKEVLEIGAAVASVSAPSAPSLQPSSTIFNHMACPHVSQECAKQCSTSFTPSDDVFQFVGRKISQSNHRVVILGCGRILSKTSQYDYTYTDTYTHTHTYTIIYI